MPIYSLFFTHFILGQAGSVSFESLVWPGNYIRHRDYLIYTESSGYNPSTFNDDATWIAHPDKYFQGYYAFEASNVGNYFIRHQNYRLRIDQDDGTDLFKQDASFKSNA